MDRSTVTAIALSLLSLPFLVPHVLEDFRLGIAARAGLSTPLGAAALGAFLAVQMLGLVWAGQGRRLGLAMTALAGALWTAGSLWEHGPEFLGRGLAFRSSVLSALWLVGLTLGQAGSAVSALLALRGPWLR